MTVPLETAPQLLAVVSKRCGGDLQEPRVAGARRLSAGVAADRVVRVLRILRDELGWRHLSAISGVDTGVAIEVLYHVSAPGGVILSLRVELPRTNPQVATAMDVYPAANLYEREIRDLLGVEFVGHPNPRRLLLYEGWPEGEYPLRKDWRATSQGGESRA